MEKLIAYRNAKALCNHPDPKVQRIARTAKRVALNDILFGD